MCNLKKAFDTRSILSTPASDVYERLKTNGKPIKIARDLLTINETKMIEIIQRQQFSFMKTSIILGL